LTSSSTYLRSFFSNYYSLRICCSGSNSLNLGFRLKHSR
jgi:hypothetical protein